MLRACDAAAALNAIMIELFIRGIISLVFPPQPPRRRPIHSASHPFSRFISHPGHFISYILSLRRIVAFCNFPYVSASRISRHAERAHASAIFAMRHTRRYRDEADEVTHTARKFLAT